MENPVTTINCPRCGTVNPADAPRCSQCGTPLSHGTPLTHGTVVIDTSDSIQPSQPPVPAGQIIKLDPLPFTIGRDPESNLHIDSLAVSWHHATITGQNNAHFLTDLGSTNKTYVHAKPTSANVPTQLRDGDTIRIGPAVMVYRSDSLQFLPTRQEYQLDGRDLGMTYHIGFPKSHDLNTMRDVSLSIKPKEFVSIIGGSGSGKSTLLMALNGARRATAGRVLINGEDLYRHYEQYQPLIGYVPQSDIVHDDLTIFQSLWFGARLRFPSEPENARQQRISRVLEILELTPFKAQLVGKLSGGQKKRVSIALEMMAEPSLLFMDEPTSGLDEGLDKSMMRTLRGLADRGHIVIVITHTTLNINLCDQLALIARGNLVYYGPPRQALTFLGVDTYADVYEKVQSPPDGGGQDAASGGTVITSTSEGLKPHPSNAGTEDQAGRQWAAKYRTTPIYDTYVTQRLQDEAAELAESEELPQVLSGAWRGSFFQQARVLTQRTAALTRHDARTLLLLLLVLPLIGIFLATLHYDQTFKDRGHMLVHLDTKTNDVFDKLPSSSVTICQSENPPEECQMNSGGSKVLVQSIATFSPASDAQRLLFMMSLSVTLLGVFASAYTIVIERNVFLRERMVNLRVGPYLASKVLVYGGLSVLSAAVFLFIIAFGVRLPDQGLIMWGPLELFISLALTALAGVSIGLLLSAVTREVNAVTYLMLGVLFTQILFPGVLFQMKGPVLETLSRLTVTRWSLEALGGTANMVARSSEGATILHIFVSGANLPGIKLLPGPNVLSFSSYPSAAGDLLIRWGVLALFSVIFLGVSAFVLNRRASF
ncbi:MAG: ATP-binding cassette domain-containing protein [Aggregatilineales bacterium]